ncbi:MAG: DUF2723 domain-containing protein [Vicinamibacteria bacterium]
MKHLQVPDRLVSLALLVPAGVYLLTLLPGVGHTGDSAELALSGHVLGVPHPTGYPLYVLAAHLFERLVPSGSVAWKANLLSAVCATLALAALLRLQRELGICALAALAATLGLAFSPTFWRHAIVAEVYAPHALLFAAALLLFLRFERSGRRGDLYAACAVYALAFGNHLLMATLLPAIGWLVWSRDRAAFTDPRALAAVGAIVAVCASQYLFLIWRGEPGGAPYRAGEIGGFADLVAFATGRQFQGSMFAIPPAQLATARAPLVWAWLAELGPWLPLAAVGVAGLGRTRAGIVLLLAFVANLAFALGYDIPDLAPYFIPCSLLIAVFAGAGLDRLARGALRTPALAGALAVAAAAALSHAPAVIRDSGRDAARRALLLAEELPRGIVVLGYHDYQFLNYLKLAEGRAAPELYPAHLVDAAELAAYVRDGRPLSLPQLGLVAPPGLPVYSAKLNHREAYRAAGLRPEPWRWGVLRLSDARSPAEDARREEPVGPSGSRH